MDGRRMAKMARKCIGMGKNTDVEIHIIVEYFVPFYFLYYLSCPIYLSRCSSFSLSIDFISSLL